MVAKKDVRLYVEGGGDSDSLHSVCRRGFSAFLEKAGLSGRMPRIIACGSRNEAYNRFVIACAQPNIIPILLVDSECSVPDESDSDCKSWQPWQYLKVRDGWNKPENASDEQCNLMIECMENWFFADIPTLKKYYGQGFDEKKMSVVSDIEKISKQKVFFALQEATKNTKTKGPYNKGNHSFEILALIDSSLVIEKSKWAARFVNYLRNI